MDALALLCTLHADGPSSLKRLRSRGCGDLSALLSRTPDTVAEDLSIERPAARRLIREARLLADRVGITALEVEEAPPTAAPAPATRAFVRDDPAPSAPEGGLDSVDRALVERITRPAPPRPEVPGAEPEPEAEKPKEADAPGGRAGTEPSDGVTSSLPGWMEGPSVSRADDPFSLPDEDFGAPEVPAAIADNMGAEPVTPDPSMAADPEVGEEAASAANEPEAIALPAPAAGEVLEAIDRALPEPSSEAPPAKPIAPLVFGAAVFGESIDDHEEPVEVDLSVEPSAPEPEAVTSPPGTEKSEVDVDAEQAASPEEAEVEERREVDPEPVGEMAPPTGGPTTHEPAPIPAIAEAVAAASSAALPGMDEALVEDLERLGIGSFAELSRAESLVLTRGLGVTFAQARRLRFLARRAEADGTAWPQAAAPSPASIEPAAEPEAPEAMGVPDVKGFGAEVFAADPPATPEPLAEEPPAASPEEPEPEAPLPFAAAIGFEPEAGSQQGSQQEFQSESQTESQSGPDEEPQEESQPEPALEATTEETGDAAPEPEPAVALEPQGVRVDPSEVKARPRFGDQFARAAQQRRTSSEPGRTVLGWNFEIPRPEPEALPLASLLATPPGDDGAAEAVSGSPAEPESDAAGPFADA